MRNVQTFSDPTWMGVGLTGPNPSQVGIYRQTKYFCVPKTDLGTPSIKMFGIFQTQNLMRGN